MAQSGYSPISLDVQSVQFSDFHRRSQIFNKQGGFFEKMLPKGDYFSQALYTFDIGQNDLTAGYKLNMTTEEVKAYVPDVLGQFSNAIKKIYGEGGRIFWVHNTGPVGCLPYVMDRFLITAGQIDKYGCASPFNDVAQYFNLRLKEAVAQLRKDLPEATITYCGAKKTVDGKEIVISNSCKDPSVRINWDGTHFTEAANKWIFNQIANGSFSDPPISLEMACHRMDH
ncbi:gdsl esterase/lipase [Quercus suber]|uniref:Gdsl esterase/lipase n=1 Tax=Quercus suber TaxID=58331 RepID=A0AAW0KL76_QUESU